MLDAKLTEGLREIGIRLIRVLQKLVPMSEYTESRFKMYNIEVLRMIISELDFRIDDVARDLQSHKFRAQQSPGGVFSYPPTSTPS